MSGALIPPPHVPAPPTALGGLVLPRGLRPKDWEEILWMASAYCVLKEMIGAEEIQAVLTGEQRSKWERCRCNPYRTEES